GIGAKPAVGRLYLGLSHTSPSGSGTTPGIQGRKSRCLWPEAFPPLHLLRRSQRAKRHSGWVQDRHISHADATASAPRHRPPSALRPGGSTRFPCLRALLAGAGARSAAGLVLIPTP